MLGCQTDIDILSELTGRQRATKSALNAEQQVLDRKAVEHSGSGIAQFVECLDNLSSADVEQIAIGIEISNAEQQNNVRSEVPC